MRALQRTIKGGLKIILVEKRLEEWNGVLSEVMFAYNTMVHSTTGVTPYFPMLGVEARVPTEILIGLPETECRPAAYTLQPYQKLWVG